jgi:hypothetical protein
MASHHPVKLSINEYIQTYLKRMRKAKELGEIVWNKWKDDTLTPPSGIVSLMKLTVHHNDGSARPFHD